MSYKGWLKDNIIDNGAKLKSYYWIFVIVFSLVFVVSAALTFIYPEKYRAHNATPNVVIDKNIDTSDMNVNDGMIVTFKDKALENVIRETVGEKTGPLYVRDVKKITSLYLIHNGVKDLEGVQYLYGLKSINLAYNDITDISALSRLKRLETLTMNNNQIEDISPLAGLKKLNYIDLANNKVKDAAPLGGLTELNMLDLFNNQITDITALGNLNNLETLDVSRNQIKDMSPVKDKKIKLFLNWGNN